MATPDLDILRKALERAGFTSEARRPWQELLGRRDTSQEQTFRPDPLLGEVGSWVQSYSFAEGGSFGASSSTVAEPEGPLPSMGAPARSRVLRLLERGSPEINFVPYAEGTNRSGNAKGPSLLGHPVSFEVVGPTLQSPFCDWTWNVVGGAGPNGGDTFQMSIRPDGLAPVSGTLADGYGIPDFQIGDSFEPNGGLYLILVEDGSAPGNVLGTGLVPIPQFVDTARFEIYRVSVVSGSLIEIHPSKRLREHWQLSDGAINSRYIRGVALVRPHVTRLAAIPGSGAGPGRERVFAFVRPETSASSELYPPKNGGVGSWTLGGFAPEALLDVGDPGSYGAKVPQPLRTPIRQGMGMVEKGALGPTLDIGLWKLTGVGLTSPSDVGLLLKIYHVVSQDTFNVSFGTREACLGTYEIVAQGAGAYTLRRVPELRPNGTGTVFYGPGPFVKTILTPEVLCYFTIHEPVSSMWQGSFSPEKLQAGRLAPLVDPRSTRPTQKQVSAPTGGNPPPGSHGQADRALFPTQTSPVAGGGIPQAARPGSLLDLGFRVVLFPAKQDPATALPLPDFDHPIDSLDVVIDPSVQEAQSLFVDYDAGLLVLSHAPPALPGGQIVPNGIITNPLSNPRGEVLLWAACVAHPEGNGAGIGISSEDALGQTETVYGKTVVANIDPANTTFFPAAPFFGPSTFGVIEIVLDRLWQGPSTGTIDILRESEGSFSFGTWSYGVVTNRKVDGRTVSALGLLASSPSAGDPTPAGTVRSVQLRRMGTVAPSSFDNTRSLNKVFSDTSYGSGFRASTLRFKGAVVSPQADGSAVVDFSAASDPFSFLSSQWGYLSPSFNVTAFPLPPNIFINKTFQESGLFGSTLYQNSANPTGGAPGYRLLSSNLGIYLNAEIAAAGTYEGFMTPGPLVSWQQNFRLIYKFRTSAGSGGSTFEFFAGLMGAVGGSTPNIDYATSTVPIPVDIIQAGVWVNNTGLGTNMYFYLRSSNGVVATPLAVDTGVSGEGLYVLILETDPVRSEISVGLFPENADPVVHRFPVDPSLFPLAGDLYIMSGIRKVVGAPRVNLDSFYMSLRVPRSQTDPTALPPL